MNTIDTQVLFESSYPNFNKFSNSIQKILIKLVNRILKISEINNFIEKNSDITNIHFIDEIFEYLNFSFRISNKDIRRIPSEGRLVVVSNHPIGSLDSLAIIKAISEIRPDVKILATDLLIHIKNIGGLLLPFKLDSKLPQRENVRRVAASLENEEAVILFPAGEVSRLKGIRVMDSKWNKGAIYFSKKLNAPILPMYVDARNSIFFYLTSAVNKSLATLLLSRELFNKKNKTINISIGDPIPANAFSNSYINDKVQAKLLRKHTYSIPKNKKGIYKTEENIIHPVSSKIIRKELNKSQILGYTHDKKLIYLTTFNESPNVLKELSRLREITFRKVGEGTGNKSDFDGFDKYYDHIVVWDDAELELVGSYRIGNGERILEEFGPAGFYTSTLFNFSEIFIEHYLQYSIELGRSFIQKKYWNTHALQYLWQGIGAYIKSMPEVKYLFGGVSISQSYNEHAQQLIIYYFSKWFGSKSNLVTSKFKYSINQDVIENLYNIFTGNNYKEDYRILKNLIREYGLSVPVLYKHYSELCEEDGTLFLDFGIDSDFGNCIDGMILVEVEKIKSDKKQRYIDCHTMSAV
jgi:putative hemolysin